MSAASAINTVTLAAARLPVDPATDFIVTPSLIVGSPVARSFCGAAKLSDSILNKRATILNRRAKFNHCAFLLNAYGAPATILRRY